MGSLSLRPGNSLTVPRTVLSVGFIRFVSSANATQATGFRLFPRWDLPPTEHASLRWSHYGPEIQKGYILTSRNVVAVGVTMLIDFSYPTHSVPIRHFRDGQVSCASGVSFSSDPMRGHNARSLLFCLLRTFP